MSSQSEKHLLHMTQVFPQHLLKLGRFSQKYTSSLLANMKPANLATLHFFSTSTSDKYTDAGKHLTHVDEKGQASMVNVGFKQDSIRTAFASGKILLGEEVYNLVLKNEMKKGDVLSVAQLAGVMASKHTSLLIPLCHNIPISHVAVELVLEEKDFSLHVRAMVTSVGKTGVEMEALTAVSVAALTVYDMCKAVSHNLIITDIKLDSKTGGKKDFVRKE